MPCHVNDDADYDVACQRCEKKVKVTAEHAAAIRPLLRYDKRTQGGANGRSLQRDYKPLGLLSGDRLEPSRVLIDVAAFDTLENMQVGQEVEITFWMRSEESLCLHRTPLWNPRLGLTPSRVICVDVLHTCHLGVLNCWTKVAT